MGNSSLAGLSLAAARIDPLSSGDNLSTVTNGWDSSSLAGLSSTAVRIDPLGSRGNLNTRNGLPSAGNNGNDMSIATLGIVSHGDPVCAHCGVIFGRNAHNQPYNTICGNTIHYQCIHAHRTCCERCQADQGSDVDARFSCRPLSAQDVHGNCISTGEGNNLSNVCGLSSSAGLSSTAVRIDPLGSGSNSSTSGGGFNLSNGDGSKSTSLAGLSSTDVRIDPLGSGYKLSTHVQGNNLSNVCGLSSSAGLSQLRLGSIRSALEAI